MIGLVDGNNFYVSCERSVDPKLRGRPVAVLSNNDGCCVAMSPEFKALGIPRGTPYFQLKNREYPRGDLVFRSSNYELYGDISRRIISILRDVSVEVEQYSIDEAFVRPPTTELDDLDGYGARIRERLLRWVGIPCGIGFAKTKTLAKIANHIGKKLPGGVFSMPEDCDAILADLPVGEVWGVGRRLPVRLRAVRIISAKDLRDAPDDVIRSAGGVTLLRTATELRGIECDAEHEFDADPESITCSRSFGEQVDKLDDLASAMASFVAKAAEKLRRHGQLASGCNVYVQLAVPGMFRNGGGWESSFVGRTVVFERPTDATNEMLKAVRPEVEALFASGARYRKAGVVFFGLEKADSEWQPDLFSNVKRESSSLFKAVDAINRKLGGGKIFTAAEGLGNCSWRMKREKLSRRATTRWDEILKVK